jgi:phage-related tail protein
MDIMLSVSKVVGSVRRWVEANPALVGSIMKVTAAIGALLVVVGGLMLSIGECSARWHLFASASPRWPVKEE